MRKRKKKAHQQGPTRKERNRTKSTTDIRARAVIDVVMSWSWAGASRGQIIQHTTQDRLAITTQEVDAALVTLLRNKRLKLHGNRYQHVGPLYRRGYPLKKGTNHGNR